MCWPLESRSAVARPLLPAETITQRQGEHPNGSKPCNAKNKTCVAFARLCRFSMAWSTMQYNPISFATALPPVLVRKATIGQKLYSFCIAWQMNTGHLTSYISTQFLCGTKWADASKLVKFLWLQRPASKANHGLRTCFFQVISVLEKSKLWSFALWVLCMMTDKKVTPDGITYNAAISACGSHWQHGLALLQALRLRGCSTITLQIGEWSICQSA